MNGMKVKAVKAKLAALGATVFEGEWSPVCVSAEHPLKSEECSCGGGADGYGCDECWKGVVLGTGELPADYYGEFRGGYPWIDPRVEKIAEEHGCYWEWLNAGAIALAEV